MKKPNFFIVGAPKCGTTSLYHWLKKHEKIFMSEMKEPCYFNTDENNRNIRSLEEYESLFSKAQKKHKVVGEASVWYLGSKEAINNIKKYNPKSKILACLRNPIEMAISLHEQQLFSGNEHIKDFESAWKAQVDRRAKKKLSYWTREHRHLIYGEVCKLGDQIERLFEEFKEERVKITFLKDIKEKPKKEYEDILNFLELDKTNNVGFKPKNKGKKEKKSRTIRLILRFIHGIKNRMGIYSGFGIGKMISKINKKEKEKRKISKTLIRDMKKYFNNDIKKLEKVVDRDLSNWI